MIVVYGLKTSASDEIRYVGQTHHTAAFRLKKHLVEAKSDTASRRCKWIRSVLARGEDVQVVVLENDAIWGESEKHWIAFLRLYGANLVNGTDGGDGAVGHKHSEETRRQLSESHKGHVKSDESKRRLSESLRAHYSNPENRAALSMAQKGRVCSEETKAKISAKQKGVVHSPERVAINSSSHMGIKATDETKRKMGIAQRARWADPEYREKMCAIRRNAFQQADYRERMSVSVSAAWSRRKEGV